MPRRRARTDPNAERISASRLSHQAATAIYLALQGYDDAEIARRTKTHRSTVNRWFHAPGPVVDAYNRALTRKQIAEDALITIAGKKGHKDQYKAAELIWETYRPIEKRVGASRADVLRLKAALEAARAIGEVVGDNPPTKSRKSRGVASRGLPDDLPEERPKPGDEFNPDIDPRWLDSESSEDSVEPSEDS